MPVVIWGQLPCHLWYHLARKGSTSGVAMLQQTETTGVQEQGKVYEMRNADWYKNRL